MHNLRETEVINTISSAMLLLLHVRSIFDTVKCERQRTLLTRSNRFFHASSRCDMSSIQCDKVASIPAVVALNVNASPLKSMAWAPCCCSMLTTTKEN